MKVQFTDRNEVVTISASKDVLNIISMALSMAYEENKLSTFKTYAENIYDQLAATGFYDRNRISSLN